MPYANNKTDKRLMIIDDLKNIDQYHNIPKEAADYLQILSGQSDSGHYELGNGIYANIDIYEPKMFEDCRFEAHKKYIDIQMLLEGQERLDYTNIERLEILQEYDETRDVMFFKDSSKNFDSVILEPSKFVFIYPWEAHKPQISTGYKLIKKVVVKIPVNIL